ncbi:BIR repeat [Trinorchestia longiramus]|nr:BIR repeat [Trinorchestia longiramus]
MAAADILSPKCASATFDVVEMNLPEVSEPRRRILGVMNFQSEGARLETFTHWPSKNVNKEDLARNGFVFSHKSDQVKCFFCKGSIVCWDAGDVVEEEHKKNYRDCPLVTGKTAINIPIDGKMYERINQYLKNQLDEADPAKRRNIYEADAKKADDETKPISFNEFTSQKKREASFDKAPLCLPKAADLAAAGFFYSMFADLTQCYSCGGGVINWSPNENPKEVHDKLYPNCPLTNRSSPHSDSTPNLPQEKRKRRIRVEDLKDDFLEFPWVKSICQLYPAEVVKNALAEDLRTHCCLPYNVNQALEVVDDYDNSLH